MPPQTIVLPDAPAIRPRRCATCKFQHAFDQRVFAPNAPAGTVVGCTKHPLRMAVVPDTYAMIPPGENPAAPHGGMRIVGTRNHLTLNPAPDDYVCDSWATRIAGPNGLQAN